MGQFNSGYRRPDFSGSQNFGVPSNSSLAPVPASQPKSKKKLLIIILTIGMILIIIFALTGNIIGKKNGKPNLEESQLFELIDKLSDNYMSLVLIYNTIFKLNDESGYNEYAFFAIEPNDIQEIFDQKSTVDKLLEQLKNVDMEKSGFLSKEQKTNYKDLINTIESNSTIIEENSRLIEKFSNAFYQPLLIQSESDTKAPTCQLSSEAADLLLSEDEKQKMMAEKYKEIYCSFYTNIYAHTPQSEMILLKLQNDEKIKSLSKEFTTNIHSLASDKNITEIFSRLKNGREINE